MSTFIHETRRALRVVPLDARTRWHAWRAVRHHSLRSRHQSALSHCADEARQLLDSRR